MIVMRGLASYPQDFAGSYVVAESLLEQIDPSTVPRRITGIGIEEMAAFNPDGKELVEAVHKMHDAFGVKTDKGKPFRVKPDAVEGQVRVGGQHAIRLIYDTTIQASEFLSVSLPDTLTPLEGNFEARSKTATERATDLTAALASNQDLFQAVLGRISWQADGVRGQTQPRQAYVLSDDYKRDRAEASAQRAAAEKLHRQRNSKTLKILGRLGLGPLRYQPKHR